MIRFKAKPCFGHRGHREHREKRWAGTKIGRKEVVSFFRFSLLPLLLLCVLCDLCGFLSFLAFYRVVEKKA